MLERVSTYIGDSPLLIYAPHGQDDDFTGDIAESMQQGLDCYAVINRGFKRGSTVDEANDIADCNRIDHLIEDVVYEEVLEPIETYIADINNNYTTPTQIIVHGASDKILDQVGDCDLILGIGSGKSNRQTIPDRHLAAMLFCLSHLGGFSPYLAPAGSRYAGWSRNNYNQYCNFGSLDLNWFSAQFEIIKSLRTDQTTALEIANDLTNSLMAYQNWVVYGSQVLDKKHSDWLKIGMGLVRWIPA